MAGLLHMEDIAQHAWCTPDQRHEFRDRLEDCGFVVLDPGDADDLVLDDIMRGLGEPVEYHFGTKLTLAPDEGAENVQFTTRGMPLHADATFNAGPPVKYIGMHCVTAPEVGGETLVASAAAFFEHAPADLLETMSGIVVEYRNRISGYYKDRPEGDHPRLAPIQVDPETGEKRLVIGFSDADDPTRTHDSVVVGYGEEESAELLRRISAVLHRPSVLYAHAWRPGQVMILDNRRLVHGRAAFPGQPRKIVRLSVF
ncbi:TauD/TfdA family dioxygenase (plasmid) [Streptomyces decoyicus]|uniref:TauD/TfdA dioxygenase family protein n=1 Tax=Streptomyces decoyicus TaxID=249567 RepID=UPI002E30D126|nr:TauD/TfdA family dioxygenase [Streptomyces decoyicus]